MLLKISQNHKKKYVSEHFWATASDVIVVVLHAAEPYLLKAQELLFPMQESGRSWLTEYSDWIRENTDQNNSENKHFYVMTSTKIATIFNNSLIFL